MNTSKPNLFPLRPDELKELVRECPTPFYLYDEMLIRENARRFTQAYHAQPAFKEFFAVKAAPNPYLLKILAGEGFGADCSSLAELRLAERSGITGENIMFTANDTPDEEFREAHRLGAILNLDDISHIDVLRRVLPEFPKLISFRYNPGPLKSGNAIIGKPEEAKYGLTREQLFEAYQRARELGATRFGLHTMVASNELNATYHIETARMLFELAVELKDALDIRLEFINTGGGIGIPYRPGEQAVDMTHVGLGILEAYKAIIIPAGLDPLALYTECGRCITGPFGWLVTTAIRHKEIYRSYIGVDASMADLMRPGMYGAYHHITVSGKENQPESHTYDVAGSLCENCDKFAVQRKLPEIEEGDILIIHDAGAHGRAMGFNYNGKLRCGELLRRTDGSIVPIRRKETLDDYFATLDLQSLTDF